MPELPEVEVARRALQEHCAGRRILRCSAADDPKVIDGVSPSQLESSLAGKTVLAAARKGKNLWLRLDSPPFPSFQFGMTGAVYIKGVELSKYKRSAVSPTEEWPSKYSKLFVELEDGVEFSFTDKRRLAKVRLLEDPESVPPISELGPDALFEPMQVDEFMNALRKKKIAIKALLLDQSFISGIGNWIADEVLYQARIHPMQIAANLSKESCETLHRCIKEVIEKALEVGADSSQFPEHWIYHSRDKKPGKAFVEGKRVEFITAGGRTTAFVPELQKFEGPQSNEIPSTKLKRAKTGKKFPGKQESDDEDAEVNENSKPKSGQKSSKGTKKQPKKARDDDEEEEESEKPAKGARGKQVKMASKKKTKSNTEESDSEDEEVNESSKFERRRNSSKGGKKPKKTSESDDDDDDEEEELEKTSKRQPLTKGAKSNQASAQQRKKQRK
ncbi:formamidopyrimidine-DNA glycosylase-like isoform X1 [Ananas comosus]|uniref:Formamidopyrimidine-DNA glycosylase n=2 Tax=Ananas comosus TaxID=4615 RepID=A0A199V6V6_ANACO|nr:formamidopyrimidine-DNA glycosylase-like isoform X1 [Ananas comosus]OAY72812.1 Formamidopyrimidine-DNA glycosylase [Ananas comosus]